MALSPSTVSTPGNGYPASAYPTTAPQQLGMPGRAETHVPTMIPDAGSLDQFALQQQQPPLQTQQALSPAPLSMQTPVLPITANGALPVLEAVATGVLVPTDNQRLNVKIEVDAQGQIYQPTLGGYQPIGQIDPYGNYQLVNGLQGNLFRDDTLHLIYEMGKNPFQRSLVQVRQQRASAGSITPMIREQLTSKGIDGRGVTIADIEPFEEDPKTHQLKLANHTQAVAASINDPAWGVAPGATVKNFGWHSPDIEFENDDVTAFNQFPLVKQVYQDMNKQLQRILDENLRDPSLRIVNVSWGISPAEVYTETYLMLNELDDNGDLKFPQIRQAILGPTADRGQDEQMVAIVDYVNRYMNQDPTLKQLHSQFIDLTRRAEEQGISIFSSAANSHHSAPFNVPLPPGHEMATWSNSPYVICVAASNTSMTPYDTSDDTIASFSSRGDGASFNPTIAAPGDDMGLSQQYGSIGRGLVVKGTSYSSPISAGVAAMMLQVNPYLTPADIRNRMIQTATQTQASFEEQGYGMLNPVQVVASAAQPSQFPDHVYQIAQRHAQAQLAPTPTQRSNPFQPLEPLGVALHPLSSAVSH